MKDFDLSYSETDDTLEIHFYKFTNRRHYRCIAKLSDTIVVIADRHKKISGFIIYQASQQEHLKDLRSDQLDKVVNSLIQQFKNNRKHLTFVEHNFSI